MKSDIILSYLMKKYLFLWKEKERLNRQTHELYERLQVTKKICSSNVSQEQKYKEQNTSSVDKFYR